MENKIFVYSSSEISSELKDQLKPKLIAKFGNFEIEYKLDKSLALGLLLRFKDEEYYYNLANEVNHILKELSF